MTWMMMCLGLSIGLCSSMLHAQTRFQLYDTLPAVSRYRSVEACLSAVTRTEKSVATTRPEFPDTMPFRKNMGRDSMSPDAVAIAQQCAASFNPDSVVLTGAADSYTIWMTLYLFANRDDAAAVVAQRRVAMARQHSRQPNELYGVLSGIMNVYGSVRPIRWDKARETATQLEVPGVAPDSITLYHAYVSLYVFAEAVGDTVVQEKMAERMLAIAESMPPDIKRNVWVFSGVQSKNFRAMNFLTRAARMDSLRRGPEAYVALARANWKHASQNSKYPIPTMIGEHAVPVKANFWFSSSDASMMTTSDHPRPALGTVSLIVFLRQGCNARTPQGLGIMDRATYRKDCWGTYAILRRLRQQYPSLEITLAARTAGYSVNTGTMSPPEEAAILQKWWLGFHRLPATLAVATTPFFRLEGVDRRRIDQPVDNDINYLFGRGNATEIQSQQAYLIDTNGMVLLSTPLTPHAEHTLNEMLGAIMQRGK